MSGSRPVMINRDTPSRTSRQNQYRPHKRQHWEPKPGEPDHPLAEPVRQLCAEIEHYKRRALRAEAETQRLRGLLRPEIA